MKQPHIRFLEHRNIYPMNSDLRPLCILVRSAWLKKLPVACCPLLTEYCPTPHAQSATDNGLQTTVIQAKLPLTNNCLYDYIRDFGKARANHSLNLEGVS